MSQSYLHYHKGYRGGKGNTDIGVWESSNPGDGPSANPILSESNSCLPRPCLMGLRMYLGFLNFPACFMYKVFP